MKKSFLAILALTSVLAIGASAQEAQSPSYNCSGLVLLAGKMETVTVTADASSVQLAIADQQPVAYPVKESKKASDGQMIIAQTNQTSLFGDLNKYVLVITGDTAKLVTARIGKNFASLRDKATVHQYDLSCSI